MCELIRRNQHFYEWVKECLSPDEVAECKRLVDEISREDEDDVVLGLPDIPQDMRIVKQCFLLLKDSLREARRDAQLATDARLWEQLDACKERVRQRDMEISILLSKIQGLKDAMATMSKKQVGYCADELRLNIDSRSQTSLTGSASEIASQPSCRQPSTASRMYQKYSSEDRQAFAMFVSKQHSTRASVKALKSKLTLKSQEFKELASRTERSQEKSRSLGKMLESLRADPSARRGSIFEAGLIDRISQEEIVREDNAINLRQVKNEIVALREAIESEKMHLVSRFEQWKLAAENNRESACHSETGSQQSLRSMFEDSCSVSSCATEKVLGDHGDDGVECCQASLLPTPVCDEGEGTIFDELKIGMGDDHSKKPFLYQKHGINYSNLIVIPTDGCVEKTSTARQGSGRSSGTVHRQDYTIGADALAKLRQLTNGMDDIGRLENKNTQLTLLETPERDVDQHESSCSLEKVCSAPIGMSSEIITERSSGERSDYRDVTSLHEDLDSDKSNDSICNQYLGQKQNTETDETNMEIDDMVLTGDPEVDEEVINFYRARNKLFL